MRDIDEFAREVARRITGAQKTFRESFGEQFDLAVDEVVVSELVKAVYYASMIPDEGRYPMVCLMSYRKDFARAFHFRFDSPREPTALEIAKLAHATDSGGHICVISDEGKLLLDGIDV